MKKIRDLVNLLRTAVIVIVLFVVVYVLLAFISIKGWEYSNSNSFCANVCHDVHPEESITFQDSHHASIKCVECHMGRTSTIRAVFKKAGHIRHLPAVVFNNYGRPTESESLKSSSESCERCHNPLSLHSNSIREIKYYLPDRTNTEKRRYFILQTGGGERHKGLTEGIHWHIVNRVEYIAADEHKQDIPWVRTVMPDGQTVEYIDDANHFSMEEMEHEEKHVMDCLDCHNRLGHPFLSPDRAVDAALADGRLSHELPFVKKELVELLTVPVRSQEEAVSAAADFEVEYRKRYPEAAASQGEEIVKASELAQVLAKQLIFKNPVASWRSFPDNSGHRDFPGCFRCHDGEHRSKEGLTIPLECNLCHSIPATVDGDAQPPEMSVVSLKKPESHLDSDFIFSHRIQASDACTACHGPVAYASDDSSFCAASACHGESWEAVKSFDASMHSFPLKARHSEALCYECHGGVEKPSDECSNCHATPRNHFAMGCNDCHAPVGWSQSSASLVAQADGISHPLQGMDDCSMCHDPKGMVVPAPSDHQIYGVKQCTICHKSAKGI